MMKAVGSALLLVSCAGIGFRIARDFRERPRQLRALIHALRVLQAEVEFSVTPLPQALRQAAVRSYPPIDGLFEEAARVLQDHDVSVSGALEAAVVTCKPKSALRAQDFEVLREFGKTLGLADRVHQSQHFEVALTHLDGLEREARESQQRHERLWQYVGILSGLMLVILLY